MELKFIQKNKKQKSNKIKNFNYECDTIVHECALEVCHFQIIKSISQLNFFLIF